MPRPRHLYYAIAGLLAAGLSLSASPAGQAPAAQEWPVYAADQDATHYSPLAEINRENVTQLKVAWEWRPAEDAIQEFGTRPGNFQNTPLMIDGVLYVSTPYNRVVALDAESGKELWSYDPKAYEDGQPPNGTGFVHRGVAAWRPSTSSGQADRTRIFMNSRAKLIALDGKTASRLRRSAPTAPST